MGFPCNIGRTKPELANEPECQEDNSGEVKRPEDKRRDHRDHSILRVENQVDPHQPSYRSGGSNQWDGACRIGKDVGERGSYPGKHIKRNETKSPKTELHVVPENRQDPQVRDQMEEVAVKEDRRYKTDPGGFVGEEGSLIVIGTNPRLCLRERQGVSGSDFARYRGSSIKEFLFLNVAARLQQQVHHGAKDDDQEGDHRSTSLRILIMDRDQKRIPVASFRDNGRYEWN